MTPDCIVITRDLWGCAEDLSVAPFNRKKMMQWLDTSLGALNDTADVPVYKRGNGRCM
ncbi:MULTISPECIES: hypothetical protein [Lelliottia]|uniref:Uncharacterized protein n=1 Tax=Lelliottia wanjuensis TaxID=3050585 RepID=A0AAP4D2D6_9ENTR|nr:MULTISPECIES: hypothetical protein [unclassified Lelliottia]MDK9357361.1 hypothetical protein [Lelliottia sp. V106_16]MDK9362267.1 hypothetical protein [Lelliottia sp. V106_12]MDK9373146.1 hypothetical protein [Lelliottia sp. V106_10]MDK9586566.1 hypothetical protein [Lelliottia sp. V86_10]MDK9599950.1 hypothetical protein [Lelliottia sp. V106_5]